MIFSCKHREADISIFLRAVRFTKPVAVTSTETDAVVLLNHAYPQFENIKQ